MFQVGEALEVTHASACPKGYRYPKTVIAHAVCLERRLPGTEMPNYTLMGENGPVKFIDLFGGRSQLIIHHFMFQPGWDAGCPSCSDDADNAIPHLAHFGPYDLSLVRVSRAPIEKLLAYSKRMGWNVPWYSSLDSTFNQDWGWTDDRGGKPLGSVCTCN